MYCNVYFQRLLIHMNTTSLYWRVSASGGHMVSFSLGFRPLSTGTTGSNPDEDMDVHVCLHRPLNVRLQWLCKKGTEYSDVCYSYT
jgi:hypothetical protein